MKLVKIFKDGTFGKGLTTTSPTVQRSFTKGGGVTNRTNVFEYPRRNLSTFPNYLLIIFV